MKNQEFIKELKETIKRAEKRDSTAWSRGIHTQEQQDEINSDLRLIESSKKLLKQFI